MAFRNILTAIFAIALFNSCQQIDPLPPKPIVVKGSTSPVPTIDTVYSTPGCTTNANLYVNGSSYIYLNYKTVNTYPDRVAYVFQDGLAAVNITILMKAQKSTRKKFEIIPYNSNYNFANYAQAMVIISLPSLGKFQAKSGSLNFLNSNTMGFCGLQITNTSGSATRTFDFTY